MVLVKSLKFLHPFFPGEIGKEKLLGCVLERELAYLDYENIDLTIYYRKICIFPKGLVHGFGQKFEISSSMGLVKVLKFLLHFFYAF